MLQQITTNISPLIRHGKDNGRDYLVVPTVILTEGVHAGSNGPLFYPGSELAPSAPAWNGMPVLVYHAMVNGQYDSANHPEVAEKQQIGFLRNTRWKNGKLLTDCWIDESRARRIDYRILNSLVQGKPMEVSTGLFTENEEVHGEFRGKPYIAVARNYRPDHLAWLPDQIGACSLEAGCGTLKLNQTKTEFKEPAKLMQLIDKIFNASSTQNIFCRTGKGGGKDPACTKEGGASANGDAPAVDPREAKVRMYEAKARSSLLETKRKQLVATIKKLLSFDKNHPQLAAMRARLDKIIEDKVATDRFLTGNAFCPTGKGGGNCGGTCNSGGECSGECNGQCPSCKNKMKEVTVANRLSGGGSEANASMSLTMRSSVMNKTQVINNLIASEVWNEDDRGWLETQSLGRLQLLAQSSCQEVEDALQNDDSNDGGQGDRMMKGKKDTGTYARNGKKSMMDEEAGKSATCNSCEHADTCPALNHAVSVEEYIQRAPSDFREILTNGLNSHKQEKAELVQTILTNAEGLYTQNELEKFKLVDLKRLAKLASPKPTANTAPAMPSPLFIGQAGGQQFVGNAMDDEPLLPPVMNFAKK